MPTDDEPDIPSEVRPLSTTPSMSAVRAALRASVAKIIRDHVEQQGTENLDSLAHDVIVEVREYMLTVRHQVLAQLESVIRRTVD